MNRAMRAGVGMGVVLAAGALVGGLGGCATRGGSSGGHTLSAKDAEAKLAPFKAMAGTWTMKDDKGQEQVAMVTTVIAAGSVVHETMFPGSPHEMVNTYHLDGDQIVVTHYCAAGNQPRMACKAGAGGVYHFTLRDITNHAGPDEVYMGELTVTMKDADHMSQSWASFQNGKRSEGPAFTLTRKKG